MMHPLCTLSLELVVGPMGWASTWGLIGGFGAAWVYIAKSETLGVRKAFWLLEPWPEQVSEHFKNLAARN